MTTLMIKESKVELYDDGYMMNREDWNPDVASFLAKKEGIELGDLHWDLIHFLRGYYEEFQISPNIKILVKHLKAVRGEDNIDTKVLYTLFPKGPSFQGCKIAGLPKPTNCIDG